MFLSFQPKKGPLGARLVEDVQAAGGQLTIDDLSSYAAKVNNQKKKQNKKRNFLRRRVKKYKQNKLHLRFQQQQQYMQCLFC